MVIQQTLPASCPGGPAVEVISKLRIDSGNAEFRQLTVAPLVNRQRERVRQEEGVMSKRLVVPMLLLVGLISPYEIVRGQATSTIRSCRLPENGIEETYTASIFVACVPKANQCAQVAAQSFKAPPNVRFIKGFADPFLRPWGPDGVPNRCDPRGNADVPCWAATELSVYKRAPNKKCQSDSD
jgi:hypothetical protein